MQFIDRLLYRVGIVRRSVFNELRKAAEQMVDECNQEQSTPKAPKPPKFKLIQGGKQ